MPSPMPPGCEYRYTVIEGSYSWFQAARMAQRLGGHLATPATDREMTCLSFAWSAAGAPSVWIGATDERREGSWVWRFGHAANSPVTFFQWYPGQPDNCHGCSDIALGDEDCLELPGWWGPGIPYINDRHCSYTNAFVMETRR